MKKRLSIVIGPLLIVAVFVGALWLLRNELKQYHLRDFTDSLSRIPSSALLFALGLTALNYFILFGYELLGVRYIRHPMSFGRIALASFLGSVVANNFGNLLGGSSVRYRLYSAWGYSAFEIVKLMLVLQMTFWIGLFALSGTVFLISPLELPARLHLPGATTRPLGYFLSGLALSYLLLCAFRRSPVRIWKWDFSPPPLSLSILQYIVASLDLLVAAGVLYVLLPPSVEIAYFQFLTIYLLALVAVFLTQVPAGLGVIELVTLVLLSPREPALVVGSLLAFRLIYFLLPLVIGLVIMGVYEFQLHFHHIKRAVGALGEWAEAIVPRILTFSVFLAGVILLVSGATPAADGRLDFLHRYVPLFVMEWAHFLSCVVGAWLLLLARALQRRIGAAYWLTSLLLSAGILLSILKALDLEEATVLALMLGVLLPCRRDFYRRGALFTGHVAVGWSIAVVVVLISLVWLMSFAYKHVEYANSLWWQFALQDDAPRSLRAMLGVAAVILLFATWRVGWRRLHPMESAASDDLESAASIVERSPRALARLALTGDKRLLMNRQRTALLMYGVHGQSWVALGEPIGDEHEAIELAWVFRESCDEDGRWPVFFQVDESWLPICIDMGLTLINVGEEARVPLAEYDFDTDARMDQWETHQRVVEEGCGFELIRADHVETLFAELSDVSTDWLAANDNTQRGFALGSFREEYIQRLPLAVVRQNGRVVAFATVLIGADQEELAIDFVRYRPDAPDGVLDYVFIELIRWARGKGFQWCSLGVVPPAAESDTFGKQEQESFTLLDRHREHFDSDDALRQFMQGFHPVWRPKYLASPGGFALPTILADVAALISGDASAKQKDSLAK